MKSVVVYESLWGNTAALAQAVAEGIGHGARALSTAQATREELAGTNLLVAGAPVLGFTLPTEVMRNNLGPHEVKAPRKPDLSAPSMRSWLERLPVGEGWFASFESRIWWSPGGATRLIDRMLRLAGYRQIAKRQRFKVRGTYGPLKRGELERARSWGAQLAQAYEQAYSTSTTSEYLPKSPGGARA